MANLLTQIKWGHNLYVRTFLATKTTTNEIETYVARINSHINLRRPPTTDFRKSSAH
jgi:hypothetical protein